ncbi:flavin reductase family protein [Loktanella sp. M215]|uniref:flavin reductase family protein n=1 Tax=Loktanella sp. M215 TaxID=2675431 RepID=UPI001F35B8C1|nr:flavin reductase family protein [Loktanella sp. M215]MCF7701781.1 flavin reductase family protein [Loktanella sp. M215]
MFFKPSEGHGLPHDPFRAIVAPRPIGWVSTRSKDGSINLAPYSFFNAIAGKPPMVMLSSEGIKDSITNIRDTGEFVINLATLALAEKMNETSRDHATDINEFEPAGLTAFPSTLVAPPRVAESPAALECRMTQMVALPDLSGDPGERLMAIGEVVGIHIDDAALSDGMFDMVKVGTLARCGYWDYQVTTNLFSMPKPDFTGSH